MASAPPSSPPVPESIWRAPLVPAALVVTAGIVLDRYASVPLAVSLLVAAVALVAGMVSRAGRWAGLPLVYLALAGAAFGAAYHHYRRDVYPPDDVGNFAPADPHPVQVRGVLDDEPFRLPAPGHDPLRSMDRPATSTTTLSLTAINQRDGWVPATGRVRVTVSGPAEGLHAGDEVEAVGRLSAPRSPSNPGEFDYAGFLHDDGIRGTLDVRKAPDGLVRLRRGWTASLTGWLAVVRGWGQETLGRHLPRETSGLAMALLLGEGAPLTSEDWDKYVRTGIIHVVAISGQHLVILAAAMWVVLRLAGVRQRTGAATVALCLLAYALLSGGRPPAMRSAVAVCAAAGAVLLRRRTLAANTFALAWLVVVLLNPMDLFGAGCLLSFLSVAVLRWGTDWFLAKKDDPLAKVVDAARPAWLRALRWLGRQVVISYAISIVIWLAITPLAAARYNLVSPVGILLGPPLTLLTTVALLAGFLFLPAAVVCPPLAAVLAVPVHWSLAACVAIVDFADQLPGAHFTVGAIPEWWLWVFYTALLAVLTQPPLRRRWRWGLAGGLAWLCIGLVGCNARVPADELCCTFLAVGHGGCTVLETPDGRTLLYDAGALGGPDVTRRQIAPFLWSRGIRRIDEVLLSHADLDHFNGLPQLLDRFTVGQVTWTPTFSDKQAPGVAFVVAELARRGIATRLAKSGDVFNAGPVTLEVLHPPSEGVPGNENARSLVLAVRHAGHTLLLTGDLEGEGLRRVLSQPPVRCQVLMAPHHGSRAADPTALAQWARPKVVVSCQGAPRGAGGTAEAYTSRGAQFLSTWDEGAVTIRSHVSGLVVETFRTGQRIVVRGDRAKGRE
jgi:competence protein ComEC